MAKVFQCKTEELSSLLKLFGTGDGLEECMISILELIRNQVEVNEYAFYIIDRSKTDYILKATLHTNQEEKQIQPSYKPFWL